MDMQSSWLTLALGGALLTAWPSQRLAAAPAQEKRMSATFYQASREDTRRPAKPPVPIRDAVAPLPAETPDGAECLRRFCNAERSSRSSSAPASRPYRPRWSAPLDTDLRPQSILASRDRVVVVGMTSWVLLNDAGETQYEETTGAGEVVLDPANDFVYFANTNGRVAAHSLRDGRQAFFLSVYFGDNFARAFIDRIGARAIVLSLERPSDPLRRNKPTLSVLEAHELQTPAVLSEVGRLKSAREVNHLFIDTVNLFAARQGERLVLATTDRVYTADLELQLQTELTGEFEPLQLSLDSGGRIYLIVRTEKGHFLWVLTPDGGRLMSVPLSAPSDRFETPPIVGFDHRIYIVNGRHVRAVDADGKTAWEHLAENRIAGAVVTADHHLLISTGSQILTLDPPGNARLIFEVMGETWQTAPVLTASGQLLVTSARHVYCAEAS